MRISMTVLQMAAAALLMTGLATAHGVPPGPAAEGGAKHELSATDLKAKIDKNQSVIIIDARTDLNGQIIKGAIHVPLGKIEEWARGADKSSLIVTYCTCPHDEAAEAEASKLREMGFENAFALAGGLEAARKAGLEVVVPAQ